MKAADEFAGLIRGEGRYTDDLGFEGAHVALVRSNVAHCLARYRGCRTGGRRFACLRRR